MKEHSLCALVLLAAIAVVASMSAAASNADVTVTEVTVSPEHVEAGEHVTITAAVANTGTTTVNVTIVFRVNEAVAESVNVTVAVNETKRVECVVAEEEAGTYTVTVDNKSASFTVTALPTPPGEEQFRVGPTVVLRPVVDVIEKGQDGIVELYMDNPALNDVVLHLEARVMVPAGLHIYSEQYAWTTAAGIAYAPAFDIPPGTARTISIHVKADEMARVGQHTLHFSGLYYPGNNKDRYNPLSLTYPLEVKEASMKATPEPGDEDEEVPGFEAFIAIAALWAIAYLVGRKN